MSIREFSCVAAISADSRALGFKNKLPFRSRIDFAHFTSVTTSDGKVDFGKQNAVILGRETFESILFMAPDPQKTKGLVNRMMIVVSRKFKNLDEWRSDIEKRTGQTFPEVKSLSFFGDLNSALEYASSLPNVNEIFIGGGAQIYQQALLIPQCKTFHLTYVKEDNPGEFDCQLTSFENTNGWCLHSEQSVQESKTMKLRFTVWKRDFRNHAEMQYLNTVSDVINNGVFRPDRTGKGTYSKFGVHMKFDLRHSFPLLTTKRVFWRGVAEELLWFIKGSTDNKELKEKNIHIWDGNGSREFLDKMGLTSREEDDLGPIYGFQWRHFSAEYKDCHTDYVDKGIDQLQGAIDMIKKDPYSRRLVVCAWNPKDYHLMALPPCHVLFQFYVANGELSCSMYQRSADLGLGVPFNIASYALLTCLVAHCCDLLPGDLNIFTADTHVYINHVDALKQQLQREPRPFPHLKINTQNKSIDGFKFEDFELSGYNPQAVIQMEMAV